MKLKDNYVWPSPNDKENKDIQVLSQTSKDSKTNQ